MSVIVVVKFTKIVDTVLLFYFETPHFITKYEICSRQLNADFATGRPSHM